MIGEIPISDACHYMDAHDTETDQSSTAVASILQLPANFFLRPKIGYRMVARLPYTPPSLRYGTILLPLDTLWREEGQK